MDTTNRANICMECVNACGGCSWSKNFTPVDGWTAEKVERRHTDGYRTVDEGYRITDCPKFQKERKGNGSEHTAEGMMRLAEAVYKRAGDDYRNALHGIKRARNDWYRYKSNGGKLRIRDEFRKLRSEIFELEQFLSNGVCERIRKFDGFEENEELDREIRNYVGDEECDTTSG